MIETLERPFWKTELSLPLRRNPQSLEPVTPPDDWVICAEGLWYQDFQASLADDGEWAPYNILGDPDRVPAVYGHHATKGNPYFILPGRCVQVGAESEDWKLKGAARHGVIPWLYDGPSPAESTLRVPCLPHVTAKEVTLRPATEFELTKFAAQAAA